jgi:hypothetical protein
MSLTYTWKVKGLKVTNAGSLQDVVIGTQWDCTGTDEDGNSGTFSGATPFKASDVSPDNFIDFSDLTEQEVLGWIQAVAVGSYWDHINGQILKQVAVKKNPVTEVSHMPWDPPTENNPANPVPPTP